ncbi:MAG: hypothetical protein ACKVQS_05350 [Fimbriimonadaceae bacterium]
MPLLDFLKSNPTTVHSMPLRQIIGNCGDGVLKDGAESAAEFRSYLSEAPPDRLIELIQECVRPEEKSGFALQDLINELGRRLELKVENGLYQGRVNSIGFDGLWETSDDWGIIIEVKTTDAYRINLDILAKYKAKLIESERISNRCSMLIVVLREDTGDLEAQVRGSRHAWDIRLISVTALIKLLKLKLRTDQDTQSQIEKLLVPFEYTKIDPIIDIAFTAAVDTEEVENSEMGSEDTDDHKRQVQNRTPKETLDAIKKTVLATLEDVYGINLRKVSRAKFSAQHGENEIRIVCSISKRYVDGGYWYALHPGWEDFLSKVNTGVFVLACAELDACFAIPVVDIKPYLNLDQMWRTERNGSGYWHIVLREVNGRWMIQRRGSFEPIDMEKYKIKLLKS